jgi:hypothetical protein
MNAGQSGLSNCRVIEAQKGFVTDPPPFRNQKHAAATISLKGQRWSRIVDEATDLLLEVSALAPNSNVDEGAPRVTKLLYHSGVLFS